MRKAFRVVGTALSILAMTLFLDAMATATVLHRATRRKPGPRSRHEKLLESWGKRGLEIAGKNLEKLVGLCREWQCGVTLVVYPWPDNIKENDRDSLQVRHWRDWSAQHAVGRRCARTTSKATCISRLPATA